MSFSNQGGSRTQRETVETLKRRAMFQQFTRKYMPPDRSPPLHRQNPNRQSQVMSMDDIKPRSRTTPKILRSPTNEAGNSNSQESSSIVNTRINNTPIHHLNLIVEDRKAYHESYPVVSPHSNDNAYTQSSKPTDGHQSPHQINHNSCIKNSFTTSSQQSQYNGHDHSRNNSMSSPNTSAYNSINGGWGQAGARSNDKQGQFNGKTQTDNYGDFNNDWNVSTNSDNIEAAWDTYTNGNGQDYSERNYTQRYGINDNYNSCPPSQTFTLTPNGFVESSGSVSTSTRARTRDHTIDSLGAVKLAPAIGEFDDIKTEAITSWDAGIDLKLDSQEKAKKKAEWLSQTAFFSQDKPKPVVSPPAATPTQSKKLPSKRNSSKSSATVMWKCLPDGTWELGLDNSKKAQLNTTPVAWDTVSPPSNRPSTSWDTNEWYEQDIDHTWHKRSASNRSLSQQRTYAEVADTKTPDWALDEVAMTSPQQMETPYNYQQQPWAPTAHNMQHQVAPMVVMPSPFMQAPASVYPAPSPRDIKATQYFHEFINNHDFHNAFVKFQKKYEKYLAVQIHEFSPRTIAKFFEATAVLMNYEASPQVNKIETARHLREHWNNFIFYLIRHLQIYAMVPEDLLSMLSICTGLMRYSPKVYKELPVSELVRVYELIKPICTPEANNECIKHLRILKALPDEQNHGSWRDLDERLPNVPTAELIVSEVVNKTNVMLEYESRKKIEIKNKVKNPWPNVDLLNYTLIHFMMLREELSKPIQKTIEELFSGKPPQAMQMPNDCAVFQGASPRSTTMLLSSSEPAIVFKLDPPSHHDEMMESFEEGSLVVLIPEVNAKVNPLDRHTIMIKMAKGAMLGQAIRASSSKSGHMTNRVVSIHINRDEIERLNWNATYSIITCRINAAATLSVLNWLHKGYVDLKKEKFSPVLTPRILVANNILSAKQLIAWDEENSESARIVNQDAVPDYIVNAEIDVGCIMAKPGGNHKARPGEGFWPRYSAQWESVAPFKRPPLYSLSPSQVRAVQFAMCHRIAVISGAPGTGKTFIAAKLAQLMSEALSVGQFHQPVLIITKSQSSLDNILTKLVPHIPDIVRFGGHPWDESLISKQATRLAAPAATDANYRQHQNLERQLNRNQIKLNALFQARFQAAHHDPAVLSTATAPEYLQHLQHGYMQQHGTSQLFTPNTLSVWSEWAAPDDRMTNYKMAQTYHKQMDHAQWTLEITYLKRAGRGLMPMVETSLIQNRFSSMTKYPICVSSIADATNWPFETSTRTGHSLRSAIFDVWKRIPSDRIWHASVEEKTMLIDAIAKVLVTYLDYEIHDVLQDQIKTAKAYDDNLIQKWTYLCRFNRIIGMTSDFAAANRDWVSALWPRAIIIDEASEILESTLASTILGFRTEHVVLLGNSDNLSKPHLSNPDLAGNPRNLDVSLFERWKGTNGDMVLLEEQHRMHSEVADVIGKFNSIKSESSSLLITAPLASCNENMVDGSDGRFEKLYGINQRAFYVNYQAGSNNSRNAQYSNILTAELTEAEVDEARYVAFFAVYLSQQLYPLPKITILTTCLLQKYLIRHILREEVPKRTCFKSNVGKISLDTIEQNSGREDAFTIISTATPSSSFSTYDNISRALPRAKYGLFVIGKPDQDNVHPRWKDFAMYMQDRDLFGDHLRLTCHTHGDTLLVSKWQDFDQMRNGGCSRECKTLMSDGHVCQETCHFITHEEIICMEACTRIRPSNCSHACPKLCHECKKNGFCPPCETTSTVQLKCGHSFSGVCHALLDKDSLQCQEKIEVELPCGHKITTECYKTQKPHRIECDVTEERQLMCGHVVLAKCGTNPVCGEPCKELLTCGHPCFKLCGVDHDHDRSNCLASCPKQLLCGHGCANGCAEPDRHTQRCMQKCNYLCFHGYNCSRECSKDCIKCVSSCPYKCEHLQCTKKCFEICNRPPCNEPCKVQFDCKHMCSGLCGEPCPPCTICTPDLKCSLTLRDISEFDADEKVYMLPDCGCVYSVEVLDMYFENQAKNGDHTAIKLWECPQCQKTIYRAFRYNKYIKTEITLVNTIKMQLEKERQELTVVEKNQIISAMNTELRPGQHNLVGGRWFVCPKNHPYYIGDCGGATEISKCPECNAPIGGTQHKVVESNRFFGEFDGSNAPAWPGQPGVPDNNNN